MTESARTDSAALSQAEVAAVGEALRAFSKAFRAAQLYLPNNPARGQSMELANAAFARVWEHTTSVELVVQERAMVLDGTVVFQEAERAGESLPWLIYRDGVRALHFHEGCEKGELETLVSLIQRARSAGPDDDDDLVTMLWLADLAHITYRDVYVGDDIATASAGSGDRDAAGGGNSSVLPVGVADAESAVTADVPAPPTVRVEDFDTTLYFLDQRESTYLQDELRREYSEDQRKLVIASLFDILELRKEPEVHREILGILEQVVVEILTSGDYDLVAYILRESAVTSKRADADPHVVEVLRDLPGKLSEPAVVAQLLNALDDSARTPVTSLLESLFGELRATALEPLASWLGSAGSSPARAAIEKASLRLAGSNTAELNRLLEHANSAVVRGALRLAAQLKTAAVVPGLSRLLRAADSEVRAEAVNVLAEIGSPTALQSIEKAFDDSSRDVRVAAYRAVGARKHVGALPRLLEAIRRKEMRSADLGEKMSLFEAFGGMCGADGVPEMDSLLNARGLFSARESSETRACAARALGLIGVPAAMSALQRASDTKDVVVRNAVARAMRGGQ